MAKEVMMKISDDFVEGARKLGLECEFVDKGETEAFRAFEGRLESLSLAVEILYIML
jgi:hypothetical protein